MVCKAKASAKKRPAMCIRSFPALSPVAKASPAHAVGGMWHGGHKVQKTWLKNVQKSFQLCRKSHPVGMESKACGSTQQFRAGCPPPPMPGILASMDLMSQWHARWADKHVGSKEWRSERNLITICGRPVGVLVVSHLGALPMEWDSYHNSSFAPLRPCILFGPTGMSVQAPKMAHKFTVIRWWTDIIFFLGACYQTERCPDKPPPSAWPPPPRPSMVGRASSRPSPHPAPHRGPHPSPATSPRPSRPAFPT